MIFGLDSLLDRLAVYKPCLESSLTPPGKIKALDAAITDAVGQACAAFDRGGAVHLTYSGGVDSSIILYKMAKAGVSVVAHTMAKTVRHPDLVHAKSVVAAMRERKLDVKHVAHILSPSPQDIAESNHLLDGSEDRPDNYYMLMKVLASHTSRVVSCDCIDELLGGYHMHRDPRRYFPHHDADADLTANRLVALRYYLSRLRPDHLEQLRTCSDHFGITVHLPYGDAGVMAAAAAFAVPEMVDAEHRKKPVYEIARRLGVPSGVLDRRKYGLVSAFHEVSA